MNKIYVEKKQWTDKNGEVRDYEEYYIYVENNYNIPKVKVQITLEKQVKQMLLSIGAIYEEEKK